MTKETTIITSIDLERPIQCPCFDRHKEKIQCKGCRFNVQCEAAREEFGE